MDNSENLELPYIMPNQAQKHVTHNEAIRYLDALVQICINNQKLSAPPTTPEVGSRYIVAQSATGEWTGKENDVAAFQDGAWVFYKPNIGWLAWLKEENTIVVFQESGWQSVSSGSNQTERVAHLGVNTQSNAQSRFGVESNDSFLSHEGSDHRLSINKAAQADTGSLVFKSNWDGRAEMGLLGSNDFSIKVTTDGVNWSDSMVVSNETGKVSFPSGLEGAQLSGVPNDLDKVDIVYLDQNVGNDEEDGSLAEQPIKSLQRLEQLFSIGRRFQVRLLSDVVWDYALKLSYPVAMLELVGRSADNSVYETKLITVVNATNYSNTPGSIQMNCVSSVYLRSLDITLDTTQGYSFLNFSTTLGYLRTSKVNLKRLGTGSCCLFADGYSFVASRHQQLEINTSARGYVARGVAAGANPNDDWRYVSNLKEF